MAKRPFSSRRAVAAGQAFGTGRQPATLEDALRLADRHRKEGRPAQAEAVYRQIRQSVPHHAQALYLHGLTALQMRNGAVARRQMIQVSAVPPLFPAAYVNLGILLAGQGQKEEAVASLRQALVLQEDFAEAHYNLANTLRDLGRLVEAAAGYRRAVIVRPDFAEAHYNLGNILRNLGQTQEAAASYQRAIDEKPDYAAAYLHLTRVTDYTVYDDRLRAMEAVYADPKLDDGQRMQLAFGLGKAFEDLKAYDKAFDFFLAGNRLRRRNFRYSIQKTGKQFEAVKTVFTRDFFAARRDFGIAEARPIFVLGMPRSGTTLVEQILASHPDVFGAGELQALPDIHKQFFENDPARPAAVERETIMEAARGYLDRTAALAADESDVVDKMPENFLYIGFVKLAFPNAKVIHCRRNPADTCLSIFKTYFSAHGLFYGYDLTELGRYYCFYQDLMAHWQRVLPGFVYDIHYEDIVARQEKETRALLEQCELDWNESCLSFFKAERTVMTASASQVRRPVYGSSVQAWKRYERGLTPLVDILGGCGGDQDLVVRAPS